MRDLIYNLGEEIEANSGGEWIVENLCLGDNVAVPTTTDEPFWLMLNDKTPMLWLLPSRC